MTVNLVKLCVGVDRVEQLAAWQELRRAAAAADPNEPPPGHVTRMFPKRRDEILEGGSLYWVIKGQILVRQLITGLDEVVGADGIRRCRIGLESPLVLTRPQPRRAFQGWRYLKVEDAPADMDGSIAALEDIPEAMRAELAELGLI